MTNTTAAFAPEQKVSSSRELLSELRDGYQLTWVDDGTDYPALWSSFAKGGHQDNQFKSTSSKRDVFLAEYDGRSFVLKRDRGFDKRPEKKIWSALAGSPYYRLIDTTNKAVNRGCTLAQDVYLIAERRDADSDIQAYSIAEYVEGAPLHSMGPDEMKLMPEVAEVVGRLHDFGLASNDAHHANFILTDAGIRCIDLSCNGPLLVCQSNDIIKIKRLYGVDVPIRSKIRKLFCFWLRLRYAFRDWFRRLRGKPTY